MPPSFKLPPILIQLSEVDGKVAAPKRIQVMRTGTFYDPRYNKFSIDQAMLASIKKNFDEKVRGLDLAIDLNHDEDHIAAGWVRALELTENGHQLWADVDWTPRGEKVLAEKELRYFSPEFSQNYEDNESRKKFGPTLLGGGLTNRPVIKGMQPAVALAESKGEKEMNPEQIAEYEAMKKACTDAGMSFAEIVKKVQELSDANKALSEKVTANEAALKLAEKKGAFDKMLSEGKACEAQREHFMSDNMVKFAETAKAVKLEEQGHGGSGAEGGGNAESKTPAQDKVLKLAEERRKNVKGLEMGDAISKVLHEDPTLRTAYEKEVAI